MSNDFIGDYELVVGDFISSEKQGQNKITNHFDAVITDPWTGRFFKED